jgi:hypothetical protein
MAKLEVERGEVVLRDVHHAVPRVESIFLERAKVVIEPEAIEHLGQLRRGRVAGWRGQHVDEERGRSATSTFWECVCT